jgi:hypothetical protein
MVLLIICTLPYSPMSPALAVAHTKRNSSGSTTTAATAGSTSVHSGHAASARLGQSLRQASSAHIIVSGNDDVGDTKEHQQQHKKRDSKTHADDITTATTDDGDQGELSIALP